MNEYEYGIRHHTGGEPHRTCMTLGDARDFIKGWDEYGGKPNVWIIIRRPIARWEDVKA